MPILLNWKSYRKIPSCWPILKVLASSAAKERERGPCVIHFHRRLAARTAATTCRRVRACSFRDGVDDHKSQKALDLQSSWQQPFAPLLLQFSYSSSCILFFSSTPYIRSLSPAIVIAQSSMGPTSLSRVRHQQSSYLSLSVKLVRVVWDGKIRVLWSVIVFLSPFFLS